MFARRLTVFLLGITLVLVVYADSGRRRHWSDGVYFPPPMKSPRASTYDYPTGTQTSNPWTTLRYGDGEQQLPTPESLGYPSVDYDPYRGLQGRRLQSDPRAIREDEARRQRLTPPPAADYPSLDYDPYQGVDDRRLHPYAGATRTRPAGVPGIGYRSQWYAREAGGLPYGYRGPPIPHGGAFGAGEYVPAGDAGWYSPFYEPRNYPWASGYPAYDRFDLGFPFLPSW